MQELLKMHIKNAKIFCCIKYYSYLCTQKPLKCYSMEYRITVRLSKYFEESKFFPHLNANGRLYRDQMMTWKTDTLDLYALQCSLEKCEIQWFKVALMPVK